MFNCERVYGKDKACHFVAGILVAIVAYMLFGDIPAVIAGAYAGLIKETVDEYKFVNGTHATGGDFFDMFFTLFGTVATVIVIGSFSLIDPILPIKMSIWTFATILAVFGAGVWYVLSTKMQRTRR